MKLELQPEVNVKIFLDDGTEIDDDDTLQACEAGTVFHFVPNGQHWSPSVSTTDNSTVKVVNNTASVLQNSVFLRNAKLRKPWKKHVKLEIKF